ncbi:MAG: hypothetical protein ACQEXX_24105 [Bacillota bacterium]
MKEIQRVLQSEESKIALNIFQEKIQELSNEMLALSAIKTVLNQFVIHLRENTEVKMNPKYLFMIQTNLKEMKPDLRHFGFNHPNGVKPDGTDHGYERWVTIPDNMEVHDHS